MLPEFKVVFPAPPPTTNELTAQQRTHLVRKTRKIEQLLGTTPRLLDTSIRPASPIHVSFPYALPQRRLTKTRRSSIDSTSSASSSGSGSSSSPVQRSSSLSLSRSNSNLRPINSRARSKHLSSSDSDGDLLSESWSWTYDNTAPLLRLAMESMTLETIPASPSPTRDSFADIAPPSSLSSSNDEEPASRILAPSAQSADTPSPRNSFVLASPPSSNNLRKQKMDRLRKKLGSDVPFDLVFPKESNRAYSENTPPSFRDKECPSLPLPVPTPRAARRSTGRIASSRDSISDSASIHRARRQAHSPSALEKRAPLTTHKKFPSEPQTPPVLPPLDFKRSLSFIIESPEEHGSGCTEEFGLSRTSSSKSDSSLTSGWIVQSYAQDAEFKIWSTRKGYEGWSANNNSSSSSKVNLSPISTIYFPSSNDSSPTSSASSSPHSPTTSGTERKRRPSSYRKPPPALPVELC